ncbi:MAG: acetoacetate decarboxylase [Proteobacteria bacterium]|nr:acetoacetate decarboxylase [Pseudomonadota bacterium]
MKDPIDNEFAMPVPKWLVTYPNGPYRFINREFMVITYETDMEILRKIVPSVFEIPKPVVKYEFIRMPDSTGFGDYTETGQVIPVRYKGEEGGFTISMFLDCEAPIAGGREIWGFPKKLAKPSLTVEEDVLIGKLDYGSVRIVTATMGYKHHLLDTAAVMSALKQPIFLLKNIPDVTSKPLINQLTKTYLQDITVKGAWYGPGSIELHPHALAPIADLPVKEVVSTIHFISDLTLPYGEVVEDFLKNKPN